LQKWVGRRGRVGASEHEGMVAQREVTSIESSQTSSVGCGERHLIGGRVQALVGIETGDLGVIERNAFVLRLEHGADDLKHLLAERILRTSHRRLAEGFAYCPLHGR